MKIKGATIYKISHSPSGQIVAHVKVDLGREFIMPFGQDATLQYIADAVEKEVDSVDSVKIRAEQLHQELGLPAIELKPSSKTWLALTWYFRRKK